MNPSNLLLVTHFKKNELDYAGKPVDWNDYDFNTLKELDRLRGELHSPCVLIRGGLSHDPKTRTKLTAIDCVFPHAPYSAVVMALFRSGFSKGLYEGGSVHLDSRMGPSGLARCWMAFKADRQQELTEQGLYSLKTYSKDHWDYYPWATPLAYVLLKRLIEINEGAT